MITDPIADLLVRIRNAQMAKHPSVRVPESKMARRILDVLCSEGVIAYVEQKEGRFSTFGELEVGLKYYSSGRPCVSSAQRVSKPGRRVYAAVDKFSKVSAGLGFSIISTSQGVMSDREARKRQIGGEVLASIL